MADCLTPDAEAYLRLYCPKTYGVALPREIAQELMDAGFVEWVPAPSWSGTTYGLTLDGSRHLAALPLQEARP